MSREELYNTVQDLCTHSYGPQLYLELVTKLESSALQVMKRLVNGSVHGLDPVEYSHGVVYSTALGVEASGGGGGGTSTAELR